MGGTYIKFPERQNVPSFQLGDTISQKPIARSDATFVFVPPPKLRTIDPRTPKDRAEDIVKSLLSATNGYNDLEKIETNVKMITSPEILEEVNNLLEQKGYKSSYKYTAIEKFFAMEYHNAPGCWDFEIFDLFMLLPDSVLDKGTITREMNVRYTLRAIVNGTLSINSKSQCKRLLDYIDYNNPKDKYFKDIKTAMKECSQKHGVYVDDLIKMFDANKNKDSHCLILDILQRRVESADKSSKITKCNGEVDMDFCQGATGDCWLIAAIKSIVLNPEAKKVLEKGIRVQSNGDVKVTLYRNNKPIIFTVTKKELEGENRLASGDGDVRAIEIAVQKMFIQEGDIFFGKYKQRGLKGGNEYDAWIMLLGDSVAYNRLAGSFTEENFDKVDLTKQLCTVSAHGEDKKSYFQHWYYEWFDHSKKITYKHACSVKRITNEEVVLVNPWDSTSEIFIPREEFFEYFTDMEVVDVKNS